jgi:glutathione S-transferase
MKLYTYYRSQASFRVRIALNLKGIAREDSFLHLEKGDQFAAAYRAINPQMVVPTMIDGDIRLFQSLAISRISRRAVSATAATTVRPNGACLGARAGIDQRG